MGERPGTGAERWALRSVPESEARRYVAEGWWTDATLGATVAEGLGRLGAQTFQVHSQVRPWAGTFSDVDRAARTLAGALAARGIGPGSVVVLQLPNWVEAAISFWAAAYVGAVVIPIVHFYGAKEVGYILRATSPDVVVTAGRFGHNDYLAVYTELLGQHPVPLWLVAADGGAERELPRGATPFASMLAGDPLAAPVAVDPDAPAIVGFTSGTTRDPKGAVHSHRTIGFEARQLDYMFPKGGPPGITGAPVGHFIGMLNAFLVPLLRERPVHLVDVWDPGEVLRLMSEEGLGVGGGATYFLTSLLDHPDFTPAHLAQMPFAGLGGSPVPVAVMERATKLGIRVFRSYGSTEHPSITGCLLSDPEVKRLTTDGPVLPGVELKLSGDGEILSRGPDCFLGYTDAALTGARLRRRRLVPHRRRRHAGRRRLPDHHRPHLRHHHPRRREHQRPGDRGAHGGHGRRRRGLCRRRARRPPGRARGGGGARPRRRGPADARPGAPPPRGGGPRPSEVAGVDHRRPRVPADGVGEGPEVPAPPAAARREPGDGSG